MSKSTPPKNYLDKLIADKYTPKDIPKPMIALLFVVALLLGSSGMRYGGIEGVLHTLENWLFMLVILPLCICLVASPIKYRDDDFDLKLAYYMGVFVAVLFMLGKLRYWR